MSLSYPEEPDSLRADSTVISLKDSIDYISKDAIESTINYTAKDSMPIDFQNSTIILYGEAEVSYQDIRLKAGKITFNWKDNIVIGEGLYDSAGNYTSAPVFYDKDQEFRAKKIMYNFRSKKGKIFDLITSEGEGFIHGQEVKKDAQDNLYVSKAKYTTCDHDHPHFYISSSKIKITDKTIISGPAWMVIEDVPLPFVVPFGFFPKQDNRASGILFPSYGESTNRGFFLKDGGYYFVIGEYFDLAVKGDIYSRGSWLANVSSNYNRRYKYNGNLMVQYAHNRFGDPEASDFSLSKDFNINWIHNQDPKARPNSNFRANVNAGSQNSFRNNATKPDEILQNTLKSSISYSRTFRGTPFSMSSGITHSQNLANHSLSISAPDVSVNMNRISPFKRKKAIGPKKWYEDIGVRYSMNFRNSIHTTDTMFLTADSWRNWQNGMQHSIPVSTSFKLLRYFTLAPSINYNGMTYFKTIEKTYHKNFQGTERDTIITEEIDGFFHAHDFNVSANLSTRVYGMFNINKFGLVAVRHLITPNVSFSYRPDFSDPRFGYYKTVQTDSIGERFETYSVFKNPIFGVPGRHRQGNINFSFQNNVEAKVVNKKDTLGEATKKVRIIESLNLSGYYNFFADSMKLSTLRLNGRTSVFNNKLSIQMSAEMDPYYLTPDSFRINKFELLENKKLGRITQANLSLSTNLNSKTKNRADGSREEEIGFSSLPFDAYVDFDVPWNVSINYTLSYYKRFFESNTSQTLNFSGNLSLTPKWKISFNSGYDLTQKDFTFSSFNIHRDLHCWEMSFSWIPFGFRQSYMFRINVKANVLKDLKFEPVKKDYYDY